MTTCFRLEAFTRAPRLEVLGRVHEAALKAGASVTDFQAFSNQAVRLSLEIAAPGLGALHDALSEQSLLLSPGREAFLAACQGLAGEGVPGTLALVFQHQEPDLHQTIPAVPG